MNKNIKLRLIVMNFLELGIWGTYLTSMGSFLSRNGFGAQIWIFYAMQGFVSLFMPALIGIIADKWIQAQKALSICHGISGMAMFLAGYYAMTAGSTMQFGPFFSLYAVGVAFYMPTIALSNSVAYNALEKAGLDTVRHFPAIRVFGTIAFVCSMLFVNFAKDSSGLQLQYSHAQFFVTAAMGFALCLYALTLPACPCRKSSSGTMVERLGLDAFRLFKEKRFAIFFIFSMLLGAALQITNGYANTFITSFKNNPDYAGTWGANNANALISLSQISETLCILLIPFFLKRFGIKKVMLIAMFAWVFRFGFFGLGNPGNGIWLFVLSCIVYGVAFDFFNISGSLYVDGKVSNDIRSSAQGLFMLMTNGLGASIGTYAAGKVVNHFVFNAAVPDWRTAWFIFSAYSLVVAVAFMFLFKEED